MGHGGVVLEVISEEKDVGVMIHESLKPSSQCAKAAKKANQVLGQMTRAFHYRDKTTWIRLYKTYVRCHLEYAVQAWCPWTQADKNLLESVQKRAVRMVSGLSGRGYEERLKEIGLTTLEARRVRGDMIEVWKILHGREDVNPETWFSLVGGKERETRINDHRTTLIKPRCKHEPREKFFSVRVVERWNALPSRVREAETINIFKNEYNRLMEEA